MHRKLQLPILALFLMSYAGCSASGTPEVVQPNILLISVDDLNNWIEPLGGHLQAQTPNLSSFAQEAVTFRHSYTVPLERP
jgi:arylsulfatase A-like enzyme